MRVNHGLTPQDLKAYGINDVQDIVHNPSYDMLFQEELDPNLEGYDRGVLTTLGAIAVDTGIFTGRSPKDKYLVRDDTTRDTVWWSDKGKGKNDNKPLSQETWQHLKGLVTQQLSGKRLFIVDAFCGANADTRVIEAAWVGNGSDSSDWWEIQVPAMPAGTVFRYKIGGFRLQALQRGHLVTVGAGDQLRAGQHRLVIQKHGAQAAVGSFAAALDAQASMSAHKVDEQRIGSHIVRDAHSVQHQIDLHLGFLLSGAVF